MTYVGDDYDSTRSVTYHPQLTGRARRRHDGRRVQRMVFGIGALLLVIGFAWGWFRG